jgi:hypothetical protein
METFSLNKGWAGSSVMAYEISLKQMLLQAVTHIAY